MHFINRDQHFDVRDGRLYNRNYAGFYLSDKSAARGLNGLSGITILENNKGEIKYIIFFDPELLYIRKNSIYERNPLQRKTKQNAILKDGKYFIVVDQDREES